MARPTLKRVDTSVATRSPWVSGGDDVERRTDDLPQDFGSSVVDRTDTDDRTTTRSSASEAVGSGGAEFRGERKG